jgi:chromosome segregation ATPase
MDNISQEKQGSQPVAGGQNTGHKNKTTVIIIFIILIGVLIFQFWSTTRKNKEITTLQQQKLTVETEQEKLKNDLTEITNTIDEVANKIQEVRQQQVTVKNIIISTEESKSQKTKIIKNITMLEEQLQKDKQDLENLTNKVKKSSIRIKTLETMVATLKREVEKNEQAIAGLKQTIEQKDMIISKTQMSLKETESNLNSVKGELDQTNKDLKDTKNILEDTRNTAYYIVGTKKELKAINIIAEYGSFFQKKSLSLAQDFNRDALTKINKTQKNEFAIDSSSKNVQVIPPRSEASYQLEDAGENKSILRVVNTESFWKIPYLVIIVKG